MSDIASAGIAGGTPGYGTTCRKDVLGRVEVPVVPGAAGRAAQDRLLLLIGVGPAPVRYPHIYIIARFFVRTAKARRACLPSALRRSW
jgi:hypothetical protein